MLKSRGLFPATEDQRESSGNRTQPAIAGFEDRHRGSKANEGVVLEKLEKARKWIFLQGPLKETQAQHPETPSNLNKVRKNIV